MKQKRPDSLLPCPLPRQSLVQLGLIALLSLVLTACGTRPRSSGPKPPEHPSPPISQPGQAQPPAPPADTNYHARPSSATTAHDYRHDGATHLYALNSERIYKGKMPPLLYAVGVLEVEIDSRGAVSKLNWLRAPTQAPEVMTEIERTVRQAAPFPVPSRLGKVTYTDVWLWDEGGKFQLDTLTEGQL